MTAFQAPKGTRDILDPESARFAALVSTFAAVMGKAGYALLVSPLLEDRDVFARSAGEGTDLVHKEMYEIDVRGEGRLALRPEGTASVARAFVQHRPVTPWRVWYVTPAFRYERPQAGRYRQHHQLGAEVLGSADPGWDIELVSLAYRTVAATGLRSVSVKVNSMGDAACLPAYREDLGAWLGERTDRMCEEHAKRWSESVLRVLDCKRPECVALTGDAPRIADALCGACRAHHVRVVEGLGRAGIETVQDHRLVRGFDYYTRTTFELVATELASAQNAVGGGGRYDGLVEALGGPPTAGMGFGIGIERLLLACDAEGAFPAAERHPDVFVVDLTGADEGVALAGELRALGAHALWDAGGSARSQMRAANRSGARFAAIVGAKELAAGTVTLKDLASGEERMVTRAEVAKEVGS